MTVPKINGYGKYVLIVFASLAVGGITPRLWSARGETLATQGVEITAVCDRVVKVEVKMDKHDELISLAREERAELRTTLRRVAATLDRLDERFDRRDMTARSRE